MGSHAARNDPRVSAIRRRTRNRAALLLFGRAIVTTLGVVSGALGFLTGIRMQRRQLRPGGLRHRGRRAVRRRLRGHRFPADAPPR